MSEADRAKALRRLEQARHHEEVRAVVEKLVAGTMSRDEARAWARGVSGGAHNGPTGLVVNALIFIDERDAKGRLFVGEASLHAYLDVLRHGTHWAARDPMLGLPLDIDEFAARVGREVVHWLEDGTGWLAEVRWAARTSGWSYSAQAPGQGARGPVSIHPVDLVPELVPLLEQLPRWALWREDDNANRFEIERSYCFAKLELHERTMRERGHRQFYWIDPAD
jgi:hypothetical protein